MEGVKNDMKKYGFLEHLTLDKGECWQRMFVDDNWR